MPVDQALLDLLNALKDPEAEMYGRGKKLNDIERKKQAKLIEKAIWDTIYQGGIRTVCSVRSFEKYKHKKASEEKA